MDDEYTIVATSSGATFGSRLTTTAAEGQGAPARATDGRPELADVGRLLRRGVRGVVSAARAGEAPTLTSVLHDHLGPGAAALPVIQELRPAYEHVNIQTGLDAWLEASGAEVEVVGVVGHQHQPFGLGELLTEGHPNPYGPRPGSVSRVNLPSGPGGQVRACVQCALYLVTGSGHRTALLLRGASPETGLSSVTVQVVSTDPEVAARTAREVLEAARAANVYRGQVLSFDQEMFGHGQSLLTFHERPTMDPTQLVLPPPTLAAIERQVIGVAAHKERLLAAGQHLKRGVLLYGPPGVGKTHTVRYLTAGLRDTTVLRLTGHALQLIGEACSIARALQPSMVVVEDVDLIAEERGMYPGEHPLLFQLLNEMDGLAEDADVVFVLTTNRADLLEPALAARPGRVDQAVALELPDEAGRRALFDLYRGGLDVEDGALDDAVARADGVTASFLKELLRRAALLAGDALPRVTRDDVGRALDELLDTRNAMTRVLLGARSHDEEAT